MARALRRFSPRWRPCRSRPAPTGASSPIPPGPNRNPPGPNRNRHPRTRSRTARRPASSCRCPNRCARSGRSIATRSRRSCSSTASRSRCSARAMSGARRRRVPLGRALAVEIDWHERLGEAGERLPLASLIQAIGPLESGENVEIDGGRYTTEELDEDGDGHSNLVERRGGTGPFDGSDPSRVAPPDEPLVVAYVDTAVTAPAGAGRGLRGVLAERLELPARRSAADRRRSGEPALPAVRLGHPARREVPVPDRAVRGRGRRTRDAHAARRLGRLLRRRRPEPPDRRRSRPDRVPGAGRWRRRRSLPRLPAAGRLRRDAAHAAHAVRRAAEPPGERPPRPSPTACSRAATPPSPAGRYGSSWRSSGSRPVGRSVSSSTSTRISTARRATSAGAGPTPREPIARRPASGRGGLQLQVTGSLRHARAGGAARLRHRGASRDERPFDVPRRRAAAATLRRGNPCSRASARCRCAARSGVSSAVSMRSSGSTGSS